MAVRDKQVLVHVHGNTWRVENSVLWSSTDGLGFRRSKRLDDKFPVDAIADWGSVVEGFDTGDGWLQIQKDIR